jgi:hypothetical protein
VLQLPTKNCAGLRCRAAQRSNYEQAYGGHAAETDPSRARTGGHGQWYFVSSQNGEW